MLCYEFGSRVVSWRLHKQSVPSDSRQRQNMWQQQKQQWKLCGLRKILENLQEKQVHSTALLIDNTFCKKVGQEPQVP